MRVRDAFLSEIYRRTGQGEDIMIVSPDLGAPSLDDFRRDFPHRFVNVGIAEQNVIAVAAGLQLTGKKVITYGLNPFSVTRAFDQLRNLLADFQIPVTVTALNAGSCTADAGYSHMAVENLSIMRTLRNIRIISPTDETISVRLAEEALRRPEPRYVQFDKFLGEALYAAGEVDFGLGFVSNKKESDAVIVTCGAFAAACRREDSIVKVIDCFALPVDEKALIRELSGCSHIYTLEDNVLPGGLGSMVLELLNDNGLSIPVERRGLRFKDGYPHTYTNRDLLWEEEKLSVRALLAEIEGRKAL